MRPMILMSVLLAGCATQPAAPSGEFVREIRGADTAGCEFLKVVTGRAGPATTTAQALGDARAWLRSGVEAAGGNAVVVTDSQASMSDQTLTLGLVTPGLASAVITGEAYRCAPATRPVYTEPPASTPAGRQRATGTM